MNKLLTTIILLCFSSWASAEIWVCTSSAGTYTSYFDRINSRADDGQQIIFFIDTEKGFRDPAGIFSEYAERETYRGECVIHDEFWVKCQDTDQEGLVLPVTQTLILAIGRENFSFVSQHTFTVVTHAGNCAKT